MNDENVKDNAFSIQPYTTTLFCFDFIGFQVVRFLWIANTSIKPCYLTHPIAHHGHLQPNDPCKGLKFLIYGVKLHCHLNYIAKGNDLQGHGATKTAQDN